jgi:hypothetical protein
VLPSRFVPPSPTTCKHAACWRSAALTTRPKLAAVLVAHHPVASPERQLNETISLLYPTRSDLQSIGQSPHNRYLILCLLLDLIAVSDVLS